ncbi:MAG: hypothetical protein ABWY55_11560 [Microbacterium sp.]
MGLFQHRPEDPTEWAGLPSEPLHDEWAAERLPDAAPAPAVLPGEGVGSIRIPLPDLDEGQHDAGSDESVDGA